MTIRDTTPVTQGHHTVPELTVDTSIGCLLSCTNILQLSITLYYSSRAAVAGSGPMAQPAPPSAKTGWIRVVWCWSAVECCGVLDSSFLLDHSPAY